MAPLAKEFDCEFGERTEIARQFCCGLSGPGSRDGQKLCYVEAESLARRDLILIQREEQLRLEIHF